MSTEELLVNAENKVIVLARLDAAGFKTVTAFSSAYDTTFPESLDGIISRKEFKFCIDVINQTLEDYYPCVPCYVCGYLCCLTTFGLSMLMPEPCTKELSRNLDVVLRRLNNREEFLYRGIVWRFHRSPRTHSSWIEICQLLYE
ncbi:hypothetical protein Poli38472_001414 [Pythium oligandrum]|uniref:Golgin subfamily A member 7/ERF4 domain-containing protein n=1 Tax=Pythium oligandrum TaxID=41045 RepID=A0A8K1CUL9_PYTOL|nr:hypothetical protein Poli38472_001414 [Pythium oligandrum]|eukprot:TMW69258.1 hypothetical protein Poli38472_001414 [Pythium oligandrum]